MEFCTTIGIDVSDRTSKVCVMRKMPDGERKIVVETTAATTKEGFGEVFAKFDRGWPVVFETGMHCRWMDSFFKELGFKTIIANPGRVPSITKSNTKNDRNDARELARLGIADPEMLHPVKLRDEVYQQMLRYHHARNALVAQRTQIVNQIRGFAKSMGCRIESVAAEAFHKLNRSEWPMELEDCVWPMMGVLKILAVKIKAYDALIREMSQKPEFKDKVERARLVYGIGVIGSTVIVAAIGGDADKFEHARDIGPYLGLTPRQEQSGEIDKQLHITKAGSEIVRKALTECANIAMKSDAKDTDIKLKGLRIAMRGGKIARKKARIAVARTLAVTVVALLKDPKATYVPLSERGKEGFEKYRNEMEFLAMQRLARKSSKAAKAV